MIYYKSIFEKDYLLPEEKESRFVELNNKLSKLEYPETIAGYKIILEQEFKQYQIFISPGDVWYKQTETWQGNAAKGSKVKIVSVEGSFVFYKHTTLGESFCLNKWSFVRIFDK